ncbi:hypothetical protein LguiB_000688 [Lonicera macranthoides]
MASPSTPVDPTDPVPEVAIGASNDVAINKEGGDPKSVEATVHNNLFNQPEKDTPSNEVSKSPKPTNKRRSPTWEYFTEIKNE